MLLAINDYICLQCIVVLCKLLKMVADICETGEALKHLSKRSTISKSYTNNYCDESYTM